MCDLAHVKLGAAADHERHGGALEERKRVDVALEPVEEIGVADERDLHRFCHACDLLARRQIVDEGQVVENREGRSEGADEILRPLQIDAVLYAHTGVVLRQDSRRNADQTNAAMAGRRHQADGVQHRATA